MKRALRTTRLLRVSSLTSTELREVLTSSFRPARAALIRYSRAVPPPASTSTSTQSPFAIEHLFPLQGLATLLERHFSPAEIAPHAHRPARHDQASPRFVGLHPEVRIR